MILSNSRDDHYSSQPIKSTNFHGNSHEIPFSLRSIKSTNFHGKCICIMVGYFFCAALAWANPQEAMQVKDTDYDGLSDQQEERLGTDPWISDTDGDGVKDIVEVGGIPERPLDSDNDRRIDALDVDDDGDGIPTILEGQQDTDGDGVADYLDLDSDGDKRSDRLEAGIAGKDTDNDGLDDYFDADQSGSADENGDGVDGHRLLPDRDRDGIPDVRDFNDNDGEAGDLDADGLVNGDEKLLGSDPESMDSDGDKVADALEAGSDLTKPLDTDADGLIDILDKDDDNDGVLTLEEVYRKGQLPQDIDTDADGVPDYLDSDDDGDGRLTSEEDNNSDGNLMNDDTDKDGVPDYLDSNDSDGKFRDDDGDGLSNSQEEALGSNPVGRDTDNDGINDALEMGLDPDSPMDTDGDGLADFRDEDDDGDGILTRIEGEGDRDGDGRVNYLDVDPGGYFYCAGNGRIVKGIRKFRVFPEESVEILEDGREGVISWRISQPGTYSLQFVLPKGLKALAKSDNGQLYVTQFNGDLVSLGRSENISRKGHLANFDPSDLPAWYSAFVVQEGAPPIVNMNIPLVGKSCEK